MEVPAALLAPPHLYIHPSVYNQPAYYKVVGPEIFRIGLNRGAKLPIPFGVASPSAEDLKQFKYVVLGDTSCLEGLAAPYDEEETSQVMRHEPLNAETDLFKFWLTNANTDQMSNRGFEPRKFEVTPN